MTNMTKISASDIRSKWIKLTEADTAAISSVDGLTAQLVKSYNLPKDKAHAEVIAWVGGRSF
jgi:hypothetical protein